MLANCISLINGNFNHFFSIITTILSYKTSHVIVATNSHVKVQTMNSLETQQPMFLVNKQLQFNLFNGV